jgi:putative N6-adenine-specific DNA methylase
VAPGLEPIALNELKSLGFTNLTSEQGGVNFLANEERIFQANYHLRSVTRILVRVATFKCTTFYDLEERLDSIEWPAFIPPLKFGNKSKHSTNSSPVPVVVQFRVSSFKSTLFHETAIRERFELAVKRCFSKQQVSNVIEFFKGSNSNCDSETDNNSNSNRNSAEHFQLFVVRVVNDVVTISVDSSGESLHRRGYKLAIGKAPLRETLAAGLLLSIGYNGSRPLIDPMCGCGSISLEAYMIARYT